MTDLPAGGPLTASDRYNRFIKKAVDNAKERQAYANMMIEKAEKYRDDISTQLRRIARTGRIAELEAQVQARDMILLLAGMAKDPNLDVAFRRACAKDIIERAVPLAPQRIEKIDAPDPVEGEGGTIIDVDIETARRETERMQEAARLISQVHPTEWPEWLRKELGDEGYEAYLTHANHKPDSA
jgi:hypothetical protein